MTRVRILAVLAAAALSACGGSAVKRDAARLETRCDVVQGQAVTEEQARCIARLFGVVESERCPLEVDRPERFARPVFRVRESCSGLGVIVSEADGRVLALTSGDRILYP
jgi:hypothetical protein